MPTFSLDPRPRQSPHWPLYPSHSTAENLGKKPPSKHPRYWQNAHPVDQHIRTPKPSVLTPTNPHHDKIGNYRKIGNSPPQTTRPDIGKTPILLTNSRCRPMTSTLCCQSLPHQHPYQPDLDDHPQNNGTFKIA